MPKKTIIIGFLLLTSIPFVLIRTFYPFFRFGMFAEPVNTEAPIEDFRVEYLQNDGEWQIFTGEEVGFSQNVFGQQKRNAYYLEQQAHFLEKLSRVFPDSANRWRFLNVGKDTVTIQLGNHP